MSSTMRERVAVACTELVGALAETEASTSPLLVAPSDASDEIKALAAYVCDGVDDDVTVSAALDARAFEGGVVQLLPGNFYAGVSASSFILGENTKGGLCLQGSGRRQGAIWHIPANSAAPCAVKMVGLNGGSQCVRDLFIRFDAPVGMATHGIWMQSSEGQIHNCCVSNAGGHGFILDGEPSVSGGAPVNKGFSGAITGCEAAFCGQGGSSVAAGDGFVVTALHENAVISNCFVDGGVGIAAATLVTALTSGNSYTSLTVTPLTGSISAGHQVVIGTMQTTPPTRQIVTASASAAAGATSISVDSFVANANYAASDTTYVCDYSLMWTRNGFQINAITHLHNCHPYFCYQTGLHAHQASVEVLGGEYETNGWCNLFLLGSLIPQAVHSQVIGVNTYGKTAGNAFRSFGSLSMVLSGNYFDGSVAGAGVYLQSCEHCVISGNAIVNATTPRGGKCYGMQVQNSDSCTITGNTVTNNLTPSGSYYGIFVFNSTDMIIKDNNVEVTGAAAQMVINTVTGKVKDNIGHNPIGVVTVAVPASTVAVAASPYDRVFYITAGAGSTTVLISGGPTITLTASALNTIRLPAGCTMTPTYANAPTWVVGGE